MTIPGDHNQPLSGYWRCGLLMVVALACWWRAVVVAPAYSWLAVVLRWVAPQSVVVQLAAAVWAVAEASGTAE
jgi:hypothetical protein